MNNKKNSNVTYSDYGVMVKDVGVAIEKNRDAAQSLFDAMAKPKPKIIYLVSSRRR